MVTLPTNEPFVLLGFQPGKPVNTTSGAVASLKDAGGGLGVAACTCPSIASPEMGPVTPECGAVIRTSSAAVH